MARYDIPTLKEEIENDTVEKVLALDFNDRDSILAALEDPPPGLDELRGVLLGDREWRLREGLV